MGELGNSLMLAKTLCRPLRDPQDHLQRQMAALAISFGMPKKNFTEFLSPMMAESAKAPFDSPDWIFEIKLDGYRSITVFDSAGSISMAGAGDVASNPRSAPSPLEYFDRSLRY